VHSSKIFSSFNVFTSIFLIEIFAGNSGVAQAPGRGWFGESFYFADFLPSSRIHNDFHSSFSFSLSLSLFLIFFPFSGDKLANAEPLEKKIQRAQGKHAENF